MAERLGLTARLAALATCFVVAACSGAASGTTPSGSTPSAAPHAANPTPAATLDACTAPEATQFDFYVGTWNMSWTEFGPTRFSGLDVLVRNGCEIDEVLTAPQFLGTNNYRATSVTAWDPARRKWTQRYRDSSGGQRDYVGSFENGEMVLTAGAGSLRQRLTWRAITPVSFVWEFASSADGVNWNQLVLVDYRRA